MSSSRHTRWLFVAGSAGLAVFTAVCLVTLGGVHQDRLAIEERVAALERLEAAASRHDHRGMLETAHEMAQCGACPDPTRRAATLWLRAAEGEGTAVDRVQDAVAAALQAENAAFARRLGAAWDMVELLVLCAAAFALGFFALLRVVSRRADAQQAAYDALAAETASRRAAQQVLEAEQAFSNGFFEHAPLGIVVFDAQGRATRVNGETARMFGLPSRDVGVGRFDLHTDPAAVKTGFSARAAPAFRGEVVEYRGQVTNPEDVTPHWPTTPEPRVVDELFFPVREALGHVQQVVAILRDDTAGHAARQRLALSERLATVGTLAAGVAHEINNPMSYVAANVSWLQREFESQPEALSDLTRAAVFEALREAEDGVARVQAIVRDLATFSRGSPGATTTVRLTEVIEPILRLLIHETRPRATVVQRVPAMLTVRADPLTLGHVVLNLVQNAAQAIEPGQPSAQSIDVSAAPLPDGLIRLTVADSGRGIGPDIAERIFDPFFTTKPVGQGMGLGLSICRNIVASLGGRLTFAPRPGGGTLFHVDLPASGGESGPGPARPA